MKLAEKNKSQELLTIFHVKLVEKKEIPRAARHFSREVHGEGKKSHELLAIFHLKLMEEKEIPRAACHFHVKLLEKYATAVPSCDIVIHQHSDVLEICRTVL